MNRQWNVFVIVALLLIAAGCGPGATPTPVPTPTAEPEVLATRNADVVGVWLMRASPGDVMAPTTWNIEHTLEGARTYVIASGAYKGGKGEGKYWFEGGLYKVQFPPDPGASEENYTSLGTYQVYVTRQGGKAVQVRFVVVDDPYVGRKTRQTYRPLTRVEP